MVKTDPHQKWSISTPPSTGPTATPTPADDDQAAIAPARRSGGNVQPMMAIDVGMISAPPRPIVARARMSSTGPPAQAAQADEPPKMSRPAISTVR